MHRGVPSGLSCTLLQNVNFKHLEILKFPSFAIISIASPHFSLLIYFFEDSKRVEKFLDGKKPLRQNDRKTADQK